MNSYPQRVTRSAPYRVTPSLVSLLTRFEGYRPSTYTDATGNPTIGYGHMVRPQEHFGRLDRQHALGILRRDALSSVRTVQRAVHVPLQPNQLNALASLAFNIGAQNFLQSTLVNVLNKRNYAAVPRQILRWDHGNRHQVIEGLLARRMAEARLFGR